MHPAQNPGKALEAAPAAALGAEINIFVEPFLIFLKRLDIFPFFLTLLPCPSGIKRSGGRKMNIIFGNRG